MADTGMKDHVYKILDLVGSSEKSIEDAVQNAVTRASKTIREMKWFEIVQTRGHIENGTVRHYQVTCGLDLHWKSNSGHNARRRVQGIAVRGGHAGTDGIGDQTPATDDQISASLRLAFCVRVRSTTCSSSSGSRRPTTLTRPPLMLRATSTMGSSTSSAPSFGAWSR